MPSPTPSKTAEIERDRKRMMKFDPTINSGTIIQIIVIVASAVTVYSSMKSDQALQKQELDLLKSSLVIERSAGQTALNELRTDVKSLQTSVNEVNISLAVLRSRTTAAEAKR